MRRIMRAFGGGRRRWTALAAAVGLLAVGIAAIVVGIELQKSPPEPPAAAASPNPGGPRAPGPAARGPGIPGAPPASASRGSHRAVGPVLPRSDPTALDIPAIGVHHALIELGQNPDGTLQVPSLDDVAVPGWDEHSPTPGEQGPAVIVGHVDSAEQGEGVFFDLGALRPGDTFTVTRADHTAAVFRITGVEEYPKDDFPTLEVYGNTRRAEARLITCGGRFDSDAGSYVDNIVVYARLTGSHPAPVP